MATTVGKIIEIETTRSAHSLATSSVYIHVYILCYLTHTLSHPPTDSVKAVPVLLGVLRVLLNLTHDNELGSHRLGEQEGAVRTVLDIVFLVCTQCSVCGCGCLCSLTLGTHPRGLL